jgi:hypothetical protein
MTGPGPSDWLPGQLARLLAWRRQLQGRYDATTASLFRHAWHKGGGLRALLEWLRFRRELGQPLDPVSVQTLRQTLGEARGPLAWQAVELLLEADPAACPAAGVVQDRLEPCADFSPPLARALHDVGRPLGRRAARLADLHRSQVQWRSDFAGFLRGCRGQTCVVGNAGSLNGAGLGAQIDAHRCVVRFNRWCGEDSAAEDLGARLDVWVCTPRFLPQAMSLGRGLPRWLVLTGPDACYGRAGRGVDWGLVLELLDAGVKVLTIPLPVWAEMVAELGAPPSAGVLFLAWAQHCLDGPSGLSITGFDLVGVRTSGYHHAGASLRPGRRHAWGRESALLEVWKGRGLRSLGPSGGAGSDSGKERGVTPAEDAR